MNPKEKAEELFNKYFSEIRMPSDCEGCMMCVGRCGNMVAIAKKYALIAVDEILNIMNDIWLDSFKNGKNDNKFYNYWREVKDEIEKL